MGCKARKQQEGERSGWEWPVLSLSTGSSWEWVHTRDRRGQAQPLRWEPPVPSPPPRDRRQPTDPPSAVPAPWATVQIWNLGQACRAAATCAFMSLFPPTPGRGRGGGVCRVGEAPAWGKAPAGPLKGAGAAAAPGPGRGGGALRNSPGAGSHKSSLYAALNGSTMGPFQAAGTGPARLPVQLAAQRGGFSLPGVGRGVP